MTVNIDLLCQLFPIDSRSTEFQIQQCLNIVNMPLYDIYDSILNDIFQSLSGSAKWLWLNLREGKGSVSFDEPLVDPYFNEYNNNLLLELNVKMVLHFMQQIMVLYGMVMLEKILHNLVNILLLIQHI